MNQVQNSKNRWTGQNKGQILTIEQMIIKAGEVGWYQLRLLLISMLIFLFSSFIQMGFPIIFQEAKFDCPQGGVCTQEAACANNYPLSEYPKSIAYTYNLICTRKKLLQIGFNAFLYGGFMGSLYYGVIIERRGRRYGLLQSIAMMVCGLYLSLLAGSVTVFAIGVFFFNAGFRGFYNASLLTLTQVMGESSRASTPMILSIGWALGQIMIALIGYWISNWRVIFLLTVIPLTILFFFAYRCVQQSPRYHTVKQQYMSAKQVISKISMINGKTFTACRLKEQVDYDERMHGYRQIIGDGQVFSRLKHHSYNSLFIFNSIRIRVFIIAYIWSVISMSYFISANSPINPDRSVTFNIALAGVVEIIAYMVSMVTSLNYGRVFVIKRLLIFSGVVHMIFYFIGPLNTYHGFGKLFVMTESILVRVLMSAANTFIAIYTIELFPTSIRHFALGMLGFITKLMYMLSYSFDKFWSMRAIHPNFILGVLFLMGYFLTPKLRETKDHEFKDNLSQDNQGNLMNETTAEIF